MPVTPEPGQPRAPAMPSAPAPAAPQSPIITETEPNTGLAILAGLVACVIGVGLDENAESF